MKYIMREWNKYYGGWDDCSLCDTKEEAWDEARSLFLEDDGSQGIQITEVEDDYE